VERGYNAVFDAKLRSKDNATELWLTTSAEQCGRPAARSFAEEIFCEQVTRLMDAERLRENAGVQMPDFLYGTAWKEGRTAALTELALEHGFRAIDTANQRRHYFEAGVGEGIAAARLGGLVTREDLFLQTKFTYTYGQDHRLPYDPAASVSDQVAQSLASSLEHLDTDRVDSFVLHGPASGGGWTEMDAEAWAAMTRERDRGRTRLLGVSNVSLRHLEQLAASGAELPRFVQNRCFARLGWDREVRAFCREFGITYQGFSLLTANPEALGHPLIRDLASRTGATPAQIVFRFAHEVRMLPVTGTSSERHMREDLASRELPMTSDEATAIESLVG
jgi:diketogulonate reductase-like aldo/keto reductase